MQMTIPLELPKIFMEQFREMHQEILLMRKELNAINAGHAGKLAYSPTEAAEAIGCSPSHMRSEIREGRLPAKQLGKGGKYVISKQDLEDYVRDKGVELKLTAKRRAS